MVQSVRTWTVSELLTAAKMNEISTLLTFLSRVTSGNLPIWLVSNSTTQSISNATATSLTFDTESIDNRGGHSTSSNTNRYTFQETGYYIIGGSMTFAGNSTGERVLVARYNGTDIGGSNESNCGSTDQALAYATITPGTSGDYVELAVYQSSGGSRNSNNTYFNPRFWGCYLGATS